jgi:hypothetical protein
MHYTKTGEMVRAGVDLLKEMDGEPKRKGLAWLFGYAAPRLILTAPEPAGGIGRALRDTACTGNGRGVAQAGNQEPGLPDNFKGYRLRIYSQDRHAIVLLCDECGKRGLLEDLGCTAALDRNLWKEDAAMPCEFSLSTVLGCGK